MPTLPRWIAQNPAWGACLLLWACGNDPPASSACPAAHPAFVVVIEAPERYLPEDTRVLVEYGAGEEEYRLGSNEMPQVVFCEELAPDAPPGVEVQSLRCELWTEGPATLHIEATGYLDVKQELELDPKDPCQEVQIELEAGDAGD